MADRQVLLVGLGPEAEKVRMALQGQSLDLLSIGPDQLELTVGQVFEKGCFQTSGETLSPYLMMFRGFSSDQLDAVLRDIRQASLSHQSVKAMVTVTNWNWKLKDLYEEVQQEQKIMAALIRLRKLRDSMPMPEITDFPAMQARIQAEVLLKGGENATEEAVERAYQELLRFQKR